VLILSGFSSRPLGCFCSSRETQHPAQRFLPLARTVHFSCPHGFDESKPKSKKPESRKAGKPDRGFVCHQNPESPIQTPNDIKNWLIIDQYPYFAHIGPLKRFFLVMAIRSHSIHFVSLRGLFGPLKGLLGLKVIEISAFLGKKRLFAALPSLVCFKA